MRVAPCLEPDPIRRGPGANFGQKVAQKPKLKFKFEFPRKTILSTLLFFEPDPLEWVSGPSLAGNWPNNQNLNYDFYMKACGQCRRPLPHLQVARVQAAKLLAAGLQAAGLQAAGLKAARVALQAAGLQAAGLQAARVAPQAKGQPSTDTTFIAVAPTDFEL